MRRSVLAMLPLFALAACDAAGKDSAADDTSGTGDTSDSADEYACTSGTTWEGGNEESPRMNPGEDCIGCHEREGEGPRFQVAGTVYTVAHEPDDCNGVDGVSVEITDAEGTVVTLPTNSAGNFMHEDGETRLVFPVNARVIGSDGSERAMSGDIEDGSCNACHTEDGANDAPGRVMAP